MAEASGKFDIIKAYNLFRKICEYPHLQDEMRQTFLQILEEREIVSKGQVEKLSVDWADRDGVSQDAEAVRRYREALIDLYFASHIEPIDDYINLVRKKDRAQNLAKILGTESSSIPMVYGALREFCSIPMGEVYISPDYAEGIRVALISQYISNQLPFLGVAKKHITIRDVDAILERTIWDHSRFGRLGGKAAGVILANKILLPTLQKHDPELEQYLDLPDTWYLKFGDFL